VDEVSAGFAVVKTTGASKAFLRCNFSSGEDNLKGASLTDESRKTHGATID